MSAEDQIRQFAERIVRLEEERKALAADIKDLKAEAKAAGLSPKLIATCVRILMMEAEKRAEALSGHEELDLYLSAVGLVAPRASDQSEEVSPGADASAERHARVIPQATAAAQGRATPATARVSDVARGDVLEEPALREVVRPQGRDPASDQIRPSVAGSSAEVFWTGAIPIEPQGLRNAQTGHAREIGGSVWALKNAVHDTSPESQDAGQPEHDRKASDDVPGVGSGEIITGQSEECVTTAEAGEVVQPYDPASASDRHLGWLP